MKKIIFALALGLMMSACLGTTNNSSNNNSQDAETKAESAVSYKLDDLLLKAETLVGQEVVVVGTITHTCKHSGRRCFMVGDNQKVSLRIEAKGEIGGFNRELIGSELAVTGTLQESRLTNEYLNEWEEKVRESAGAEDGSAESCEAETNNINDMRAWMKENNKEYYSLYYMDGTSFEVVE